MSRDCGNNNNVLGNTNTIGGTNNSVCIHTDKVYDACKDKDCVVDARVYLPGCAQEIVDRAINVKFRKAEIIWVYTDVEEVPFNRGFFTIDLKFFFKVFLDVFTGACDIIEPSQRNQ